MKEDARVASNSFTKRTMSAPSISADSTAADGVKTGMQDLLRRMPSQYVLSSTVEDRNEHAQLVKELGAYSDARNKVCVSWRVEKAGRFALRLVFQDQLGSLALVTAELSDLGVSIGKASTFCSTDGLAVDAFTVDRMDDEIAQTLRSRLALALAAPKSESSATGSKSASPHLEATHATLPPGKVPRIDSSMVDADAEGLSDTKLPAAMRARHGRTDHHLPDLSTPRLSGGFANLRVVKLIDEGASSTVWEGEWAGARVVIKVLREAENMTTPALTSFQEEVDIWQQLRHPCVCTLLGVSTFDGRPSMVLEYMTGGSLHDLLHNTDKRAPIEIGLLSRIVAEVASGVAYLHANGVMHRDVKSANVLLDDSRHAKVTDFGISTRFGRSDYTAETGTYRQMAPEVILHKPYNQKCDVYSYGILLWEALHRQVPFTGLAPLQAAFAVAMEHRRPTIALEGDLSVYRPLIEACWDADPNRRPDMDQVVRGTVECAGAIEASQAGDVPASGGPRGSAPGGMVRGLTSALANRLSIRRNNSPQAVPAPP